MKLVGINSSEKPSNLVKSLVDYLSEKGGSNLGEKIEVAKGIFRKMPSYLAQESDLVNLEKIVDNSLEVVDVYTSGKDQIITSCFSTPGVVDSIGFTIALGDRPFIVDTIREYFKAKKITLLCFTHPILELSDKRQVSLSFFQIEKGIHVNESLILNDLKNHLDSLIIATGDFPKILDQLNIAIKEINESNDSFKEEVTSFLKWMREDGFIFLGYNENVNDQNQLGILKQKSDPLVKSLNNALAQNIDFINSDDRSFFCSKTAIKSQIHRRDYLDIISVKSGSNFVRNFVGLFSSKANNQEVSSVPILRKKLADVLIEEGLVPNSHDYKEIINLADTIPKADFLQYSKEQVRAYFQEITNAHIQGKLKLIHIVDRLERFHYFTVALPRDRYSRSAVSAIESILKSSFTSTPSEVETHAVLGDHPLVLVRTMVPYSPKTSLKRTIDELEEIILEKTISWDEKFQIYLSEEYDEVKALTLYNFYSGAFSKTYQSSHDAKDALSDIPILESLSVENPLELSFSAQESYDDSPNYLLKVYKRGEALTLSNIVPYLENCGFNVLNEIVSPIATEGAVWANIYNFYLTPKQPSQISQDRATKILIPGLKEILSKKSSNDLLNSLLIEPGLSLHSIAILRAYVRYLTQIKITSSPKHAMIALINYPDIACLLAEYFDQKFNPHGSRESIPSHERFNLIGILSQKLNKALKKVSNLSHDRILTSLIQSVDATLRTNCFVENGNQVISLKIDCSRITNIPTPIPYREIFVSAPDFQGTHLRGGKVSRGGLRWSSRPDDFRTEVLGLMKTQMVKNSIIIPVGGKGGFILHEEPTERKDLQKKVENTYKKFIRALLDITDNRIGSHIKTPLNCICYDELDPYLVVAADRGTATFSDIANEIATKEYSFWLGDAFASGGSVGYDHKKLGITAKGAWECTKRHFVELGVDIGTQEFTVAGVGDMSGDVFGNGMLLSDNIKLVAAFDHRHIFLDPDPDSKISFAERTRLFNLPTSSWNDYDRSLLSKGALIIPRTEKSVTLTPEIKKVLETEVDNCSINEIIQLILKAPVDLLWNGGIGTYIKSSEEDHSKAADRTNDDVRVDARDLRVRIIGEGGNLGLTQKARIEYARIGGRINTDAVDNSGGVDMSDLEVNLKLLFRQPISDNTITIENRNIALRACEEEACEKVKNRNNSQSLVLSLAVKRSRTNLYSYKDLITFYEKLNRLNREQESLPSDEVFEKRKLAKAGLSRPELAILVAHTKMWVFDELMESSIPDEKLLETFLFSYFPKEISNQFSTILPQHPLRKEIIATQIANSYVEKMGCTFALRVANQTGSSFNEIFKAYLISDSIFNSSLISQKLKVLDRPTSSKIYLSTLLRIQATLASMTQWFLNSIDKSQSFEAVVEGYKNEFIDLLNSTDKILSPKEKNEFDDAVRDLLINGVAKDAATTLAASYYAPVYLDIIKVSKKTDLQPIEIAKLYSRLATELNINKLIDYANNTTLEDQWDNLALSTLSVKVRASVANLCQSIIAEQKDTSEDSIVSYFQKRANQFEQYKLMVHNLKQNNLTISTLFIAANMVESLSSKEL